MKFFKYKKFVFKCLYLERLEHLFITLVFYMPIFKDS